MWEHDSPKLLKQSVTDIEDCDMLSKRGTLLTRIIKYLTVLFLSNRSVKSSDVSKRFWYSKLHHPKS